MTSWASTRARALFGIDYPIVQGPFGGGLSSVSLTATVSALGGLGSFGCQPLTPTEIIECAQAIRKSTDRPFNFNLWVDDRDQRLDSFDAADFDKVRAIFKPYFTELQVPLPDMPTDLGPRYADQIEALLEAKPAVFSFVFGIPSASVLERCRSSGIRTVGAATTVDEAIALERAGVDAVVATGFEAGGHRVSFLEASEDSLTGLFSLLPQVADSVSIPVIAAGGIADARGIRAALALGADAVQIGTAFLATSQSNAPAEHKEKLFAPEAKKTALTRIFSGRLARGIRSRLTEELKDSEHRMAPYPMQGKFIAPLRSALIRHRKTDFISFWAGQSAALLKHRDATALFRSLVDEMDKLQS